jgi:hypothetical protein
MVELELDDEHWQRSDWKQRCFSDNLRWLLMNKPTIIRAGHIVPLQHKSLGCSVHEIWYADSEIGKD